MDREEDNHCLRAFLSYLLRVVNSTHDRHRNVQNDDAWMEFVLGVDRGIAV
jgi:hypothetical protein